MKKKILAIALILLLSISTQVGAQSSEQRQAACPDEFYCLDYEGFVIEIDPACGVVQAIVIEENSTRTETLDGVEERFGLRGIVVALNGNTYNVIGEFSGPATGTTEDVRFGDIACSDWQEPSE